MYYHDFQIVLQEVPGEVSLCFSISGCPLRCKGCHSPFLWKEGNGNLLNKNTYISLLNKYQAMASCVLFMGGEWHERELVEYLQIANHKNYKTCLYTGEEQVSKSILKELYWIKTGKWEASKGGLNSPTTNQKFINLKTNSIQNHLFLKNQNYD